MQRTIRNRKNLHASRISLWLGRRDYAILRRKQTDRERTGWDENESLAGRLVGRASARGSAVPRSENLGVWSVRLITFPSHF